MQLEKLLKNLNEYEFEGSVDSQVNNIVYDSREVKQNDVFIAIGGLKTDGHLYIDKAIDSGAKTIVLENSSFIISDILKNKNINVIKVPNSSKTLALMANAYYDYPTKDMKLIGITGTNGKTTTTYLTKSILETAGEKVGLIGTINYEIGDKIIPASKTTPESIKVFEMLSEMKKNSITYVLMEVSSHSLYLNRVYGLEFDIAAFTNLTQDHLDFHKNIDEYFNAKKILFDDNLKNDGFAIYNNDDEFGEKIVSGYSGIKCSYGINRGEIKGNISKIDFDGMQLLINYKSEECTIRSFLTGTFNAYNILTSYAIGLGSNIKIELIVDGIEKIKNVPGRFQKIKSEKGFWIIVDYSHTPDSLLNALKTLKYIIEKNGRGSIITVFGCGGDRDKSKRPIMGKIANELSDIVIVTNDNPRSEDPEVIAQEILVGINDKKNVDLILDRKKAIISAMEKAKEGDIILIAGKGHENYQEINGVKTHFDDSEIVKANL